MFEKLTAYPWEGRGKFGNKRAQDVIELNLIISHRHKLNNENSLHFCLVSSKFKRFARPRHLKF